MAWIGETHEDAAEGRLKDAYGRIVRALGRVIPFYRAYSVSPEHLHAHLDFYERLGRLGALSKRRKELIAVAVSAENGCRHCTALHAGFLRAHRVDEGVVSALAADPGRALADGVIDGADAVILGYALKLTRAPKEMTAEDVGALRAAGLSEAEVFEVALLTAYFNYTNRVGEGLGVQPE
ncbi:MAG TPA: peroxidase-related enzyme [Candidatus Limnocylindrales bacterium]|nr:peroxidase-related enzyme [Candidatus Limnocylindrales bacterium]